MYLKLKESVWTLLKYGFDVEFSGTPLETHVYKIENVELVCHHKSDILFINYIQEDRPTYKQLIKLFKVLNMLVVEGVIEIYEEKYEIFKEREA